jgi:tetratricopeptide (TPR) repeat protein
MRSLAKMLVFLVAFIAVGSPGYGQIVTGQRAPVFVTTDINGARHDLAKMKNLPMIILYFFDVASRPSQEGLLALDDLAKRYVDADMKVWAITRSAKDKVAEFVTKRRVEYPVLLDTAQISDLYHARFVLPTICILGPKLQILDYIQGGGKATEIMLVKLAEKMLQRKQPTIAKAISENVIRRNPKNAEAKNNKGQAQMMSGDLQGAEKTFDDLAEENEALGKEGLVSVYAKQGKADKAFELAEEVEKIAPDRGHVNAVKADILIAAGKKKQAQTELQKAVRKKSGKSYQRAAALNKLGRLKDSLGNTSQAREIYNQAVEIDPYYIEATANSGKTYEKEGRWDKALDAYRQALAVKKDDVFAATLAKRAQSMVALQNDVAGKKRMDELVQRLAERFRKQQKSKPEEEDTWTSRPMILSFVDMQEKGGLSERDGFATVLMFQLSDQINASGRIRVVERILIEKLIDELNLGSSDLADPETALKLGKVLAAKIIGTGSLYYLPGGTILSLRLIDTETTELPKVINRQFGPSVSLDTELNRLNREILSAIIRKYPLRGFVVQASQERIMINLGSKQGVVQGAKFEVMKEQKPIEYKGKLLRSAPKAIALLEVIQVEPDLCYARVVNGQSPIARDDKVQEKVEQL